MIAYLRDPEEIYRQSFATIRAESDLSRIPAELHQIVVRLIHACGMTDIVADLRWSAGFAASARAALTAGAPVFTDARMVADGIIGGRLHEEGRLRCLLDAPDVAERARIESTTRSAAALSVSASDLAGAVVAIGNAPTALFRLLELVDQGAAPPAALIAFPVGFVGAAESKAELVARPRGIPFLTLQGRRGGSAMAAAAVNALMSGRS